MFQLHGSVECHMCGKSSSGVDTRSSLRTGTSDVLGPKTKGYHTTLERRWGAYVTFISLKLSGGQTSEVCNIWPVQCTARWSNAAAH